MLKPLLHIKIIGHLIKQFYRPSCQTILLKERLRMTHLIDPRKMYKTDSFKVNIISMFESAKAAEKHLEPVVLLSQRLLSRRQVRVKTC